MSKKVSLNEFKEQLLDLIYEVMEEELDNLTKDDKEEVPYEEFKKKDFRTTSTGDEVFKDTINPEMYDHSKKSPMPRIAIGADNTTYPSKRRT